MTDLSASRWINFYSACCNDDLGTLQETITPIEVNKPGPDGNTALHIASLNGFAQIVQFLLRYHASRAIRNDNGYTAEELATNEEIKEIFKAIVRPDTDSSHFVGTTLDVEWLDSYKNAYRIAYENLEHMKRWLLKVPLKKLLDEINDGYIDKIPLKKLPEEINDGYIGKIPFDNEDAKRKIKQHVQYAIELEDPLGLVQAYTHPNLHFHKILNHDLAEIGSDFRFLSTQNLFNSGYLDNEAPKGLGQHIFAAILINHPRFHPYYRTGTTYRGMNITPNDLKVYEKGKIVMTRSFLSTSEDRAVANVFIQDNDADHPPVICIYKVTQLRSSLSIKAISQISDEDEVLIIPFVVFEVKEHREVETTTDKKTCRITMIELEECSSNLP
jgi:hypothetical protein